MKGVAGEGMDGWVKGEARFAPARCLRAAARPVGGGDAQTAGGCQLADRRVSQVEAGVRAWAVAQEAARESARRGREEMDYRESTQATQQTTD
jgi:hypothetical protein